MANENNKPPKFKIIVADHFRYAESCPYYQQTDTTPDGLAIAPNCLWAKNVCGEELTCPIPKDSFAETYKCPFFTEHRSDGQYHDAHWGG